MVPAPVRSMYGAPTAVGTEVPGPATGIPGMGVEDEEGVDDEDAADGDGDSAAGEDGEAGAALMRAMMDISFSPMELMEELLLSILLLIATTMRSTFSILVSFTLRRIDWCSTD